MPKRIKDLTTTATTAAADDYVALDGVTNGTRKILAASMAFSYVFKTANYTAANKEGVLADTSGGTFTVTLPASPSVGDSVVVADAGGAWGTNNLTVARNGSTISGLAENLVCNISGASVQLVYDGTTWEVYSQVGGNGGTAVTLTGTQTLTNKTISGASNTITNLPLTSLSSAGASGNVLTSDGTNWTSAPISAGISNIVTATGNTTLTSTPTLLRITPTGYGTTVTLPDATTMSIGAGKFTVQNLSEYHVRIVNASKTLLGFVDAFKTVNIDLASAATSAGAWVLNNAVRLGISAAFDQTTGLINSFGNNDARIVELDADRQCYIFGASGGILYAQVYDQTTNTFGSPTLIRNTNSNGSSGIEKISASAVLVVSITSSTQDAEAVVLSISGTTITVNTAAATTAPAVVNNIQFFRAIPSGGFIYGYNTGNAIYLMPISVSGTTPSFGTSVLAFSNVTAPVFAHTASDKLILMAEDTSNTGGFRAFSLSGSTITSGTRVSSGVNFGNLGNTKFFKLTDTTYFYGSAISGGSSYVGVISLSSLTITNNLSSAIGSGGSNPIYDAVVVNSTKVFFTTSGGAYYNILTFTGSAVSLGTPITTSPALVSSACFALKGTNVSVGTNTQLLIVDVSGSSPAIRNSTNVGTVLGSATSIYDGTVPALQTNDLKVITVSTQPTVQTALSFNSPIAINNVGGIITTTSFSWYSGNNRMPRDNYKMAFCRDAVGNWTRLRKIELA